jgi:nickel transport protein
VIPFAAVRADAHHLGADCTIHGDTVDVEAYFTDDSPGHKVRVRVLDGDLKVVAEGRTDDQGRWSCPVPPPGTYTVNLDAGPGHQARVKFAIPRLCL